MHTHDLTADLAEHDGEQVKALEADCLVGRNQHSSALSEVYEVVGGADLGLGDDGSLADVAQALVVL